MDQKKIKKLYSLLEKEIKKKSKKLVKKNQIILSSFFIGKNNPIFKNHLKLAKKFKIKYNSIEFNSPPTFIFFAKKIKEQSDNPQVKGIIINQPLPAQLSTETIFNYIKLEKDIEGHRPKSKFYPPIFLSLLTLIKYFFYNKKITQKIIVDINKDINFFKKNLKNKNIIFINEADYQSKIISRSLNNIKINFVNIASKIDNFYDYLKEADIIIDITDNDQIDFSLIKEKAIFIKINPKTKIKKSSLINFLSFNDIEALNNLYLFKNLAETVK